MHEVVQSAVSPALALPVGLEVDADALPQTVEDAATPRWTTPSLRGSASGWTGNPITMAVTQMHGQGTFQDPRLSINVVKTPDLVTPLLPALRQYQFSLSVPRPAASTIDQMAAARGKSLFDGAASCARCHSGALLTDVNAGVLHTAAEVGQDPTFAARSATGRYRTTPLRGLVGHAPYFHDGSAKTLAEVVVHYDELFRLGLTAQQRTDLVEYLKTLWSSRSRAVRVTARLHDPSGAAVVARILPM